MSDRWLLILGCSRAKIPGNDPLPAIERYNGPSWRVLRKALRERAELAERLTVVALSAEHGLIGAAAQIAAYDRLMTPERSEELRTSVAMGIARLCESPYRGVFVNVGLAYAPALPETFPWPAFWASGAIGERLHQLKEWLYVC